MYSKFILLTLLVVALACNYKQEGQTVGLQSQVDSLQSELAEKQKWVAALQEIGTLMDSIDADRNLLRVNMIEGAAYGDYVLRMKSIKRHIADSRHKIKRLEQMLSSSKTASKIFTAITNRLETRLNLQNIEMLALGEKVAHYRAENLSLIKKVSLREIEIDKKKQLVNKKIQELAEVKGKVQKLIGENRRMEGSAYYTRGEVIEDVAKHIKLAARKKRKAYKKALLMYQKALSFGITKAAKKIEELQHKYNINLSDDVGTPSISLPSKPKK